MSNRVDVNLNVCIVTSWFPSKKYPGRAPFVYNFVKNLGKFGVQVTVIVPQVEEDESVTKEDSMTIYRIRGIFPLFSMLRLVNTIGPDILHVHAPNFFTSIAIIISRIKNIPIIA